MSLQFLRGLVAGLSAGLLFAASDPGPAAFAQTTPEKISAADLLAPGPLPDVVEGLAGAPATIIEYGSLACSHCAAFYRGGWPALKARYIDAGKAKFIFREFPLDPLSVAAFMLARCAGPERRAALIGVLLTDQAAWAFVEKPAEKLRAEALAFGLTAEEFDACVADQTLYDKILAARERARKLFHVESTPTFFVNGLRLEGEQTIADFERALGSTPP